MGHGMGWGGMWFGWIFWLIIIILVVWGVVSIVRNSQNRRSADHQKLSESLESPLEILKKRYARGEITKEEFEEMKKELGKPS